MELSDKNKYKKYNRSESRKYNSRSKSIFYQNIQNCNIKSNDKKKYSNYMSYASNRPSYPILSHSRSSRSNSLLEYKRNRYYNNKRYENDNNTYILNHHLIRSHNRSHSWNGSHSRRRNRNRNRDRNRSRRRSRIRYRSRSRSRGRSRDRRKSMDNRNKYKIKSNKRYSDNSNDELDEDDKSYDDTIGSYMGKIGDFIANRYKILNEAGVGTFGRVLECFDTQKKTIVAVKIVRKVKKYSESAEIEAEILKNIREKDRTNSSLCVKMHDWFAFDGHICLVFEKLGCSLYDYMRKQKSRPFPTRYIQAFSYQLFLSLKFMKSVNLIHTDLKPENILLVNDDKPDNSELLPSYGDENRLTLENDVSTCSDRKIDDSRMIIKYSKMGLTYSHIDNKTKRKTVIPPINGQIKVIDFGSSMYDDESKSSIINTRQYRSPEVILGCGWTFPSDIWSAACILAELYTGNLYFSTHDNLEHLAMMKKSFGDFPDYMKEKAYKNNLNYFLKKRKQDKFTYFELNWSKRNVERKSYDHVKNMKVLEDIIEPIDVDNGFLDLLYKMFSLNPDKRITAEEALNHRFFKYNFDE